MATLDAPMGEKSRRRGIRIFIVLLALSLVIITMYSREGTSGPVHLMRSAVQTVATPFRLLGSQIERPFNALERFARNMTADSATLSELVEENNQLTQQLAQFNEYKAENERLESILSLSNAYSLQGVAARVISRSDETWSDTIVIDKGSSSGIKMDMPVTIGSGVIGQVCSVSATTATVRLLSDPEMAISAMLQNSRTTGILTGSVDGSLHLQYITSDVDVSVGEIVVTSGLGGVYPKGLPIGRVVSTSSVSSSEYRDITVEPISSVFNYEEVFVIMSYDETLDGTDLATGIVEAAEQSFAQQESASEGTASSASVSSESDAVAASQATDQSVVQDATAAADAGQDTASTDAALTG
jgi:rod shape-determining protein MreC